ncbi:MAG: filamentous hemagglutinin N-terminal domain-containing protein [Alphaproteobacteria bacterium]
MFHSFSDFNILTGESATFSGPDAIDNVVSRVTGGSVSTIDGLLRSTIAGADFYLVNPSGILFGANAALDVDGSFHASTADHMRLSDGALFSASSPDGNTLSIAAPEAFGFLGTDIGSITVTDSRLLVGEKQSLSLIGGNLTIIGSATGVKTANVRSNNPSSSLKAPGGQVNLISVASQGEVIPGDGQVEVTSETLGNISVSAFDLIGARGFDSSDGISGSVVVVGGRITADNSIISTTQDGVNLGGAISITGDIVLLTTGSLLDVSTFGEGRSGKIIVSAAESVTIENGSRLTSNAFGSGDASGVVISAPNVTIQNEAIIQSSTVGEGRGGEINVSASESVTIDGSSILSSGSFSTGDAGGVNVSAPHVSIQGVALLEFFANGAGRGGQVIVTATENVTVEGGSRLDGVSRSSGDAGGVVISASNVSIQSESLVISNALAEGRGGVILVTATESVTIEGSSRLLGNSFGSGDVGSVEISAPTVSIQGEALIESGSDGEGRGGEVIVTASESVTIDGSSSLFSRSFGSGNAGAGVAISAPTVTIQGEALIVTHSFAEGRGGEIIVMATESATIESGASLNSRSFGSSDTGGVVISAPIVTIQTDGSINSTTFGSGRAGDVTITATGSVLFNDSVIFSDSEANGDGGDIPGQPPLRGPV